MEGPLLPLQRLFDASTTLQDTVQSNDIKLVRWPLTGGLYSTEWG